MKYFGYEKLSDIMPLNKIYRVDVLYGRNSLHSTIYTYGDLVK